VWREKGILKTIPEGGLVFKWRTPVAYGYAGPAVAAGRVFVADYDVESGKIENQPSRRVKLQGKERLHCLDAETGKVLWTDTYACAYQVSYPGEPRVTPCVSQGKVFTLGAMGDLRCLDVESGQLVWSKDLKQEYLANKPPTEKTPLWGYAGHPLVDGQKLICLVGGTGSVVVAFDKDTGRELWRGLSASEPGYCPPTMIEVGGTRQLILWHPEAIHGLNPENGQVFWSVPLKPDFGMSIATPRHYGKFLFASGVRNAAALLTLDATRPQADIQWRGDPKSAVYCANSSPFIEDDVIYGVDRQGELRAVDLSTGKRLWETYAATTGSQRAGYATAFLVKHDDRFVLFNDQGDLIFAKMDREGYHEIGRFHVLEPTNETFTRPVVWSHPAFANKCLFARNDKELVCVSLAAN
jgi:outer membrane protein assembly factor BamB